MGDYTTLLGAEDVRRAGLQIAQAAEDFNRAANHVDSSLDLFIRRLDEIVSRLEAAIEARYGTEGDNNGG